MNITLRQCRRLSDRIYLLVEESKKLPPGAKLSSVLAELQQALDEQLERLRRPSVLIERRNVRGSWPPAPVLAFVICALAQDLLT